MIKSLSEILLESFTENILLEDTTDNSKRLLQQKIQGIPSKELKERLIDVLNKNPSELSFVYEYLDTFNSGMEVKGNTSIPTMKRKVWMEIAKINAAGIGRGELYIYLRTKGSVFSGGAGNKSYDLNIANEEWEVKEIAGTSGTKFRLGQKGMMNKYETFQDLYLTINILNKVSDMFDESEEVRTEVAALSKDLYADLKGYKDDFDTKADSLPTALAKGNLSNKGEKYLKSIKQNLKPALDSINDEDKRFTISNLLGKSIKNLDKRIVPIDPEDVEKENGAILDFLEDDTLDVIELLTKLPEFQKDADISTDLDRVSEDIKSTLVNTFFMTKDALNILIVLEEDIINSIERATIAGGNLQMQIKPEEFDRQTGESTAKRLTNRMKRTIRENSILADTTTLEESKKPILTNMLFGYYE